MGTMLWRPLPYCVFLPCAYPLDKGHCCLLNSIKLPDFLRLLFCLQCVPPTPAPCTMLLNEEIGRWFYWLVFFSPRMLSCKICCVLVINFLPPTLRVPFSIKGWDVDCLINKHKEINSNLCNRERWLNSCWYHKEKWKTGLWMFVLTLLSGNSVGFWWTGGFRKPPAFLKILYFMQKSWLSEVYLLLRLFPSHVSITFPHGL